MHVWIWLWFGLSIHRSDAEMQFLSVYQFPVRITMTKSVGAHKPTAPFSYAIGSNTRLTKINFLLALRYVLINSGSVPFDFKRSKSRVAH